MLQRSFAIALLCLSLMNGGCRQRRATVVDCGDLGTGYRLSNGTIEILVVPKIGRVMRYGYVGEENVLFVNMSVPGSRKQGTYVNWGGDKAWIWPQSDWPKLIGREFPPLAAMDGAAWTCESVTSRSSRLRSGIIEPWGVRIERTIALDPSGARVVWSNRLVKIDDRPIPASAVWTVTQVPAGSLIRARLLNAASNTVGYQLLLPDPWRSVRRDGFWLNIEGNPKGYCKMGIEADVLEATVGEVRFTQTLVESDVGGEYLPMERAQVYAQRDPPPGHSDQPAYIEMEFTSPRSNFLSKQREIGMTVEWNLSRTR